MTTTATIVTIGTLSALGFGAYAVIPPPQTPDAFPWKDVSGGGAALLLLVALFVFLKHLREEPPRPRSIDPTCRCSSSTACARALQRSARGSHGCVRYRTGGR